MLGNSGGGRGGDEEEQDRIIIFGLPETILFRFRDLWPHVRHRGFGAAEACQDRGLLLCALVCARVVV